jgi:hypothetical protein
MLQMIQVTVVMNCDLSVTEQCYSVESGLIVKY